MAGFFIFAGFLHSTANLSPKAVSGKVKKGSKRIQDLSLGNA